MFHFITEHENLVKDPSNNVSIVQIEITSSEGYLVARFTPMFLRIYTHTFIFLEYGFLQNFGLSPFEQFKWYHRSNHKENQKIMWSQLKITDMLNNFSTYLMKYVSKLIKWILILKKQDVCLCVCTEGSR